MSKEKGDKYSDVIYINVRVIGAPAIRFQKIEELAKARNPYASRADIIRELLGIEPPAALSEDEIHYFRTGEKLKK